MDLTTPSDQSVVYLNGDYMPLSEARVPVLDRGFIFGDGVYEVIPVYSRRAFRLEGHLQRLDHSLEGIRLPAPHTHEQWTEIIRELIRRSPHEDQSLYLQVTRGVATQSKRRQNSRRDLLEWADMARNHKSKKRSSPPLLVLICVCSFRIHKNTDRHP